MNQFVLIYSANGSPLTLVKGDLNTLEYPMEHAGKTVVELDDGESIDSLYVSSGVVLRKPAATSKYHVWDWETLAWKLPDSALEQAKKDKKVEIQKAMAAALVSPILYQEHLYDADERAQSNVLAWVANINSGALVPEGFVWRDYHNQDHPADAAFISGLGNVMISRNSSLYQQSWKYKADVDSLSSIEEVKAFFFTFF